MLFNSWQFLIFFICVYSLYLILPHRWQNRMLLAASYIFYGAWDWRFLGLLLFSTTLDYLFSLNIARSADPKNKKKFLLCSILVNLSLLGFFKYFNFFASSLTDLLHLLGFQVKAAYLQIILPVGISFYTFQALSYTIDVYRGEVKPPKSFLDFALYVAFFPQLVAGPIERAKHMLPQILQPRIVTSEGFYQGCFLIFWGLFEKIFIADNLARIVNPVFEKGPYQGAEVLLGLYAFTFQIFCDFDGYSNMARGLGKTMGFNLLVNFNLPYFATNPKSFWQRWHISLSTWLKDYLYIPLGGNRGSHGKTCRNLAITMLLGGLWHGAAWNFILWGLYHGFLLVIYRGIPDSGTKTVNAFRTLFFFHLVVFSWLLFRATSWHQIAEMSQALFLRFSWENQPVEPWLKLLALISPLLIIQIGQVQRKNLMFLYNQHWFLKTFGYALMTYLILGWGVMNPQEFIYFQF